MNFSAYISWRCRQFKAKAIEAHEQVRRSVRTESFFASEMLAIVMLVTLFLLLLEEPFIGIAYLLAPKLVDPTLTVSISRWSEVCIQASFFIGVVTLVATPFFPWEDVRGAWALLLVLGWQIPAYIIPIVLARGDYQQVGVILKG